MNNFGYSQPWPMDPTKDYSKLYEQQNSLGRVDPHFMPPPQNIPWNIQQTTWGMPYPQPQVVQFTAHQELAKKQLHCKRKTAEFEPEIPVKQLITEEKMVAHLNNMHLSNNYTAHNIQNYTDKEMENQEAISRDIEERLKSATAITLSDEIKKLNNAPLLPPEFLKRLEKPCMSLIPWEPRAHVLPSPSADEEENRNPSKVPSSRPGVLVSDLENRAEPTMDVEM